MFPFLPPVNEWLSGQRACWHGEAGAAGLGTVATHDVLYCTVLYCAGPLGLARPRVTFPNMLCSRYQLLTRLRAEDYGIWMYCRCDVYLRSYRDILYRDLGSALIVCEADLYILMLYVSQSVCHTCSKKRKNGSIKLYSIS